MLVLIPLFMSILNASKFKSKNRSLMMGGLGGGDSASGN